MKLLFVCTANQERSPTAEDIFKDVKNVKVKSAGTDRFARVIINKRLVDWADRIYVMEDFHRDFIVKKWPHTAKKIVVLGIPDVYFRGDPELIRLLKEKVKL